ncbi:HAMP domain-containing histidine kinase [Planosporangium thailandense]|uniref:histidine kinase n=1 Tax=Planosporangium thailandense TaxID=765197 RepID=A0ABX0XRE6_9ACTN|nr:HAMP domain-containing sensor histidine kinase [Planosporangium thailandense]NJC68581.1 HAMP domain-containing histidine kinase [Planosporangium thailandense]
MSADPRPGDDTRLVRRAGFAIAAQIAVAVAATLLVVGVLTYSLTIRAEHTAEERAVRQAAVAARDVTDPGGGVVLIEQLADGQVRASDDAPADLAHLNVRAVPIGRSARRVGSRDYEVFAVDHPDGRRFVAMLDVTLRRQTGVRLIESLLWAGVVGVVGAALLGVVFGRRAVRPLGRALDLQRRFVADASHELRTPLAVLHTRAQLISRRLSRGAGPDDGYVEAQVGQLVADTRALGEVVDDLLLSAELQGRPGVGALVDVADLVHDVVRSVRPHAGERGVTLRAAVGDDGPLVVLGVRSSLRRALAALIDNALGHTHPGGTVTVHAGRGAGGVELAVEDDGEGLDPAQAEQLLQRFARGPEAGGRGRRFGLGLALVREVLHAHGGSLTIDGHPGEGARFAMTLPTAGTPHR